MFKDREPQVDVYFPIHDKVIQGDACNLEPNLIKAMPINAAANFKVEISSNENKPEHFQLQLTKHQDLPLYNRVLRLISQDARYRMEALEFNSQCLKLVMNERKVAFERQITPLSRVLGFNLISKIDGKHHPAFRAKKFVPWAFQCLNDGQGFNQLLVDFELGSDTYQAFIEQLKKNGENEIEAIKQAHSHQLFTELGFSLSQVDHKIEQQNKPIVFALYNRTENIKDSSSSEVHEES